MKKSLLFILLLVPFFVFPQNLDINTGGRFEIMSITDNRPGSSTLDLMLKAYDNNGNALITNSQDLVLHVTHESREEVWIFDQNRPDFRYNADKQTTVMFLLDMSGSMRYPQNTNRNDSTSKIEYACEAITSIIKSPEFHMSNAILREFDEYITEDININTGNVEQVMEAAKQRVIGRAIHYGYDTHLYAAIRNCIDELSTVKGTKVLILLTDGKNDLGNGSKHSKWGDSALDNGDSIGLINQIAGLDSSLLIFPIGIGKDPDENFMHILAQTTSSGLDGYATYVNSDKLKIVLKKIVQSYANFYKMHVTIAEPYTFGKDFDSYEFKAVITMPKGSQVDTLSTPVLRYVPKPPPPNSFEFLVCTLLGTAIIALTLVLFAVGIPLYTRKQFNKKYVSLYRDVKKPGIINMDPLNRDAFFKDSDKVVTSCKDLISLETFEYNDYKCLDCDGTCEVRRNSLLNVNFFSQKGPYKRLNWFWFSLLGSYIGWFFIALSTYLDWFSSLRNLRGATAQGIVVFDKVLQSSIEGLVLGFTISMALAWVEEFGQSRKESYGRIVLRGMLGMIGGLIIRFVFSFLLASFLPYSYVAGVIEWTMFGLLLGLILTVSSSVPTLTGVKAGLIAGFVSANVYFILTRAFIVNWMGVEAARLLSFLLYGGLIGLLIFEVVERLEEFSIIYLSPEKFYKINPISKWLKSLSVPYITIGSSTSAEVFVKWADDSVLNEHARLYYSNGRVYIEPFGKTLIKGVELKLRTRTELHNDDIITFGGNITKMQFKAEKTLSANNNRNASNGKIQITGYNNGGIRRTPEETNNIRSQIIIKSWNK